ncbi:MAG: esterase family protein [Pyrinomonadaceae bacterium]|nr:esterase family protein [Pyrinomonadaceae bacterium]
MQQIISAKLKSKLLKREVPFRVILPENYSETKKGYPVLFLLHGLFGSCENWLELTKIKDYLTNKEFVAVLVEGENGWYSDSAIIENNRFESYILEELIPLIESEFQILAQKEKRAIAGLSMGGYGALKFGLKRPDLFCFAGSMSGAFDAPNRNSIKDGFGAEELNPSILQVFGEGENICRNQNDVFQLIKNYPVEEFSRLPYFYLDCGVEDGFLEINRNFADLLEEKEIPFEFHEIKGGHDWNYWDKQLPVILNIAAKIFNQI